MTPHRRQLTPMGKIYDAVAHLKSEQYIEKIKDGVGKSHEHTFSIVDSDEEFSLNNWEDLQTYAPSAFDEETVQDLKFHRKADEIYLILRGSIRILWKVKGSGRLKNYLELSAESKCWGYIPACHCLLVTHDPGAHFLAIAFKTAESN